MDLQMGEEMDGVLATACIRERPGAPSVLILTTYNTDAEILRTVEAGATGCLPKDATPETLVDAMHHAARGETVLALAVASRPVTRLARPTAALTARELDVLQRVAAGAGNHAIAKELSVS